LFSLFFYAFIASVLLIAISAVPLPALNNYEPVIEGSQELERTGQNRREQPLSAGFPHAYITRQHLIG